MSDPPLRPAERLRRAVGRLLGRLPGPLLVRLSGTPPVTVDGETLDPYVQLVLSLRRRRALPGLCEPSPEAARRRFRRECVLFAPSRTRVASVRDRTVPGADGQPLRVRHYAPPAADDGPRPLTVFFHGGGFVLGDLDSHDEPCRMLCRHGRTHVIAVDYRLAPEHPFPAALDDCRAALAWAHAHAAELGADPARVAVAGDSAGGTLAAVVAQQTAGTAESPAAQLLIYPATDSETPRPSWEAFDRGYFLSRADRRAFAVHYLGATPVRGRDPRVSPALAPSLAGLAPALVVTAAFDVLRDEGEAYAAALRAAGTPAEVLRVPGHGHGFLHMTGVSPAARREVEGMARAWGELLARA